jgi:hypothetical protein
MSVRVHDFARPLVSSDGQAYLVAADGERRSDGIWIGWLVFRPLDGKGPTQITGRETTQPNLDALVYWSRGLEPVYLEGALKRAELESASERAELEGASQRAETV